jgi:DNA-binding transcriptional MerR regulator
MDIAEVAKRSGVPASALRYYERRGLIRSLEHDGARRRFAPGVLDQLALIALGQAAGFSLDEIRTMLTAEGGAQIDRRQLSAKADTRQTWQDALREHERILQALEARDPLAAQVAMQHHLLSAHERWAGNGLAP